MQRRRRAPTFLHREVDDQKGNRHQSQGDGDDDLVNDLGLLHLKLIQMHVGIGSYLHALSFFARQRQPLAQPNFGDQRITGYRPEISIFSTRLASLAIRQTQLIAVNGRSNRSKAENPRRSPRQVPAQEAALQSRQVHRPSRIHAPFGC
ncbi:MAG: hypothetical protein WBN04_16700 [Paracoccaceae bacterium]